MKKLIPFLVLILPLARVFSQAVLSPPAPAIPAGSLSPALSAASVSPALTPPAPTSSPGPTSTNVVVSVDQLAPLLTNLEMTIVQVLPVLSDFNVQFNFFPVVQGAPSPSTSATSSSSLPSMSTSSSSPIGATASAHASAVATATTGFLLPPGLAGLGTTNGLKTITLSRDTLRALLVLQADMERMLPVLDAVNGGTNFVDVGLTDTGVTNILK
jgi:hypothetical protein